jgi:putative oxidoreductase
MSEMKDTAPRRRARGIFRVMLSGIFLLAAFNHVTNTEPTAQRLAEAPFGHLATSIADPAVLVLLASIPLAVGGVMLLLGFGTRWAAVVLLAMIIPITLTVQVGSPATMGPLFKNIGLAGGLIFFATHGSLTWSVDGLLAKRKASAVPEGTSYTP